MSKKLCTLIAGVSMLFTCEKAFSSGFYLIEQSVSAMGSAYGGGAAYAEDASTIWFNPAGMTKFCGGQSVSGVHVVIPIAHFKDDGSEAVSGFSGFPGPGGFPVSTQPLGAYLDGSHADGGNAGEAALVPQSYVSQQITNRLWVGLGITSPFGLVTDYKDNWRGRYQAIRSSVLTINLNPSVAWKVSNKLSIGAGFNAMYLHAKLTNAVDFGLIGTFAAGAAADPVFGLAPQQNDGRVELKGNSWGFGGNAGILYEPCCGTRIGLSYRSRMTHRVKGREKFKDVPDVIRTNPVLAALNAQFQDTNTTAKVTLPSQVSVSGYHEFNRRFAVMGDVTWTEWSVIEELRFKFANELQADGVTTFKWENSFRYSLGAHYRPNNCMVARFGVAYDETPTPSKELRNPRVPDEDRFWITTGFGYDWSPCLRFDIGYAHIFVRTPKIDQTEDFLSNEELTFRGALKGEYDAYTNIVSAQVVWRW